LPRIHIALSGHEIRYDDPTPEVESFIKRAQALVDDPARTEAEVIALVYSRENPILDRTIFPERGAVTREVLDDPVYAVLQDLIFRKEVQRRGLDVAKIAARFTLTVDEAAERLGLHPTSITKAIHARRVGSWVKGGRFYLDPNGLAPLEQAGRRGPAPQALEYRVGHERGVMFRLKYAGEDGKPTEPESKREPVEGRVRRWRRVAILHGRAGKLRMFVLEPADEAAELTLGDFYVRGRFQAVQKVNNAKQAEESWAAFQPA
jgi:excisionase family DNA binding protein